MEMLVSYLNLGLLEGQRAIAYKHMVSLFAFPLCIVHLVGMRKGTWLKDFSSWHALALEKSMENIL